MVNSKHPQRDVNQISGGFKRLIFLRKGEGVKGVVAWNDEELAAVELIGHRRSEQRAANVEMPKGFACGWIECKEIAGVVSGEKKMASGGEDSGDAFAVAQFMIPD